MYITIGDGGNHEDLYNVWLDETPAWSAFRNGDYFGYGHLTVYNDTVLRWLWQPIDPQNPDTPLPPHDQILLTNHWKEVSTDVVGSILITVSLVAVGIVGIAAYLKKSGNNVLSNHPFTPFMDDPSAKEDTTQGMRMSKIGSNEV